MNSKVKCVSEVSSPTISIQSQILNTLEEKTLIKASVSEEKLPWWVIIKNHFANSTYYFGPFTQIEQATLFYNDYKKDLDQQQEDQITIAIKQLHPENLTILYIPE